MLDLKNLRPGEKVEMVVRRHWIIFAFIGFYFSLGLVLTAMTFSFGGWGFIPMISMILFWMIYLLFLYIDWINHELDLFVVTNNRIIGVEQISFLNRTVSEANLGQIQEVNSKTKGILANLLNFGTLGVQTAGSTQTMTMAYVPKCMSCQRKMLNIVDNYRDNK
ncbi:PH domain-containing protein [Candidatus Gracilibacteria bacterium]|nr:PH domain-containing protein [Candidatus Gracilibacteria bacterium]